MTHDADLAGPGPGPGGATAAADLLNTMAVGYVRLDAGWVITGVNLAGERVLGRRAADLVGRVMWEEFPGARELEFGRVYDAVMQTRVAQTMEAFYPGLDTWFDLRVEPVPDGGIALYFLDVTTRRRSAERLALLARHSETAAGVSAALSADLDVAANVGALARLVLPELGTWSVVSLVDDAGVLVDAGSWHVDPGRRDEVAEYSRTRAEATPLAGSVAGSAADSRETVVLGDVDAVVREQVPPGPTRDVLESLAPRSVMHAPMVARGRTVGLLSLYADEPHTSAQRTLAREIADRAALAIDNSASFARARTARAEAETARERLTIIARASEALAATNDLDEALERLAALVVPYLADWSIVTVSDDDGVTRDVGWAHRDPDLRDDVAVYARRRMAAMTPSAPVSTVLRTGARVVFEAIADDVLAHAVADGELLDHLRRLAPHGVAVLPLVSRGRVFGTLTLVTDHARGSFTSVEVETATEVAARAGVVLDSARSAVRAKRLAESVQRSMLTVAAPGPGVRVATRYRPADVDRQVGGDWYDTFQRSDGPTVVTIGDVMGHDVAAISSMAQLRTIMRATAWSLDRAPADVLRTTDEISAALGPGTFATVVTAHVLPAPDGSARVRWANAGHLPPAVLGPDGVVTLLRPEVVEPPLAVRPGVVRTTHETRLAPGSTVVLYTDGLIERRGEDLETRLLELARVLRDLGGESLETLLDKLMTELAGVGQRDDVALLAMRVGRD